LRSALARLIAGALVGAVALVAAAPAAFAHGDPSSHYLETGVLYPAVGDPPTQETELALLGLLHAARDNGYPIKVALVANKQDLTEDATMLKRPQDYATFVAGELSLTRPLRGLVLVVTPVGYGLAGNLPDRSGDLQTVDHDQSAALVAGLGQAAGEGGEALAEAAEMATRRLAADAGHPLPAYVPPAQPLQSSTASEPSDSGGFNLWLALGVFAGVFLFAALAYEVQRRFTSSEQAETVEGATQPREASAR